MLIKQILILTPILLAMDYIWLTLIASDFYKKQMGSLARIGVNGNFDVNFYAAAIVYALLIAGLIIFVFPKTGDSLLINFTLGAIFGLIVYGIYDFTNMATLTSWPFKLAVIDMLWGGFLCGVATAVTTHIVKLIS